MTGSICSVPLRDPELIRSVAGVARRGLASIARLSAAGVVACRDRRLRPSLRLGLGLRLGFGVMAAATALHARADDRLPAAVVAALAQAKLPCEALVAVVQPVDAASPRLGWRADAPVAPASLMKLLTTSAGLELLGPAWRWSTPVWLTGPVRDGVLRGDLVIRGSGDPTLVVERLWLLLRKVRQLGVREIRGDLVVDRRAFDPPTRDAAAFDGESLRPYNVQPDALLLNFRSLALTFTPDPARRVATVALDPPLAGVRIDATVPLSDAPCGDWRGGLGADFGRGAEAGGTGRIAGTDATASAAAPAARFRAAAVRTVDPRIRFTGRYPAACAERTWTLADPDPASYDRRALLGMWQALGGRLDGAVRDGNAPATTPTFASSSPPLAEVVRDINKYSNNVMAEQLFLTLGATLGGSGSPAAAREVLRQWSVQRFGETAGALVVDNGSGLSRDARVSARLLARLLAGAWAGPWMPEFVGSLPIDGVDGTLQASRALPGRAHLKTGTLRDVSGVAGYLQADSGRREIVVAIVDHPDAVAARPALEALLQWAAADASPPAQVDDAAGPTCRAIAPR